MEHHTNRNATLFFVGCVFFLLFLAIMNGPWSQPTKEQKPPATSPSVEVEKKINTQVDITKINTEILKKIKLLERDMNINEVIYILGEPDKDLTKDYKMKHFQYSDFSLLFYYKTPSGLGSSSDYHLRMIVKDYGKETEEKINLP
jgi:hypothetical protein